MANLLVPASLSHPGYSIQTARRAQPRKASRQFWPKMLDLELKAASSPAQGNAESHRQKVAGTPWTDRKLESSPGSLAGNSKAVGGGGPAPAQVELNGLCGPTAGTSDG
jgi:hypothetical protein